MKEKFLLRDLVYIAFLAALTSVLAYFAIPMPGGLPPLTGQSLGVMLAGLLLGAKKGAASQMVYLCLGLLGMPIFANGTAGVGVLAGPTGGFIWGFVAGAFVCGKLTEKNSHATFFSLAVAAALGGVVVVYLPGILQLAAVASVTLTEAVVMMLPFLPGDLIKALLAASLAQKIRPLTKNS
ncbi:MAG: biotin transporter BioY [Firmicutes bacterium]|nr:biotin transporter BioY [Bacillota bacterium]